MQDRSAWKKLRGRKGFWYADPILFKKGTDTLNLLNIKNLTIKHIDVKICGPTEKPPKLMTFAH